MARRTVAVASLGTTLALVSYTAPLATLAPIAADLGSSPSGRSWILSSMSLGLTAVLLTAGTLADRLGRRAVFTTGAVVLALASAGGAFATGTAGFVAGRIGQGVGAAAVVACSLALIGHALPPGPRRSAATGLWGAALAAGIAAGPLLAGLLPWRVLYLAVAVAGLVLALAGRTLLSESTAGRPRPVDVAGMVLLAAGLAVLLAGLTEARRLPVTTTTVVLLVAGAALLAGFVAVQFVVAHPMAGPELFRHPGLVAATVASLATGLGIISLSSYLPALLAPVHGTAPATAALLLLGWSGTSIVTALLTRRISERVTGGVRLGLGLLVMTAGQLGLLATGSGTGAVLAALVVVGVGTGVVNATLGREAVASVPPDRAGTGSGINNTTRYLGAAVGVTLTSVLTSPAGDEPVPVLLAGWHVAVLVATGFTLLGALVALVCARSAARTPVPAPQG
ncbi:MFS transporter [Pseudonocardia alni]|uniref:MFS transporter n=1 Tax=Pseudonocardia alni TaxID=33907 RepID=UPI00280AE776|nr:MFS transporter [Pseudonocardia alni]